MGPSHRLEMWSLAVFLLSLGPVDHEPPDSDLVESLKIDGREAFRSLFNRYHAPLFRFLRRMGVSEHATEDVLQDVFAGIWSGRTRLDSSRSIRAYLYRACRNRAANYFRDSDRYVVVALAEPQSEHPAQDDDLDYELLKAGVDKAVARLPERRRTVFELCFINGLTYREASEVLGISPKTVENHMGYALKSVREHISRFLDTE